MNMEDGNTELIFTLIIMAALLVVGIVAVVIFFRVWRKEKKEGGRSFFD